MQEETRHTRRLFLKKESLRAITLWPCQTGLVLSEGVHNRRSNNGTNIKSFRVIWQKKESCVLNMFHSKFSWTNVHSRGTRELLYFATQQNIYFLSDTLLPLHCCVSRKVNLDKKRNRHPEHDEGFSFLTIEGQNTIRRRLHNSCVTICFQCIL